MAASVIIGGLGGCSSEVERRPVEADATGSIPVSHPKSRMEIKERPLTYIEAQTLYKAIKETPNIIGYTVKELQAFKDVFLAEDNGMLVGLSINIDLPSSWNEIAVLYVFENYRKRGLGRTLFDLAFKKAWGKSRNIYTVSRNTHAISMMKEHGFSLKKKLWNLPFPVMLYNFKYALTSYRITEFLRKLLKYRNGSGWVYGFKLWVR